MTALNDFLEKLKEEGIVCSINEAISSDDSVFLDVDASIFCAVEIDSDLKYMDVFARFFYEDE